MGRLKCIQPFFVLFFSSDYTINPLRRSQGKPPFIKYRPKMLSQKIFSPPISLQMKILLVFVCENHFVDHPKSPILASSFFLFEAFTIHTPFVIRFQQHNPFFGLSFSVSKQISLPNNLCPTKKPLRLRPRHSHPFIFSSENSKAAVRAAIFMLEP